MKKSKQMKPGDIAIHKETGHIGIIGDIQYVNDRYQFTDVSGWQYGINKIEDFRQVRIFNQRGR